MSNLGAIAASAGKWAEHKFPLGLGREIGWGFCSWYCGVSWAWATTTRAGEWPQPGLGWEGCAFPSHWLRLWPPRLASSYSVTEASVWLLLLLSHVLWLRPEDRPTLPTIGIACSHHWRAWVQAHSAQLCIPLQHRAHSLGSWGLPNPIHHLRQPSTPPRSQKLGLSLQRLPPQVVPTTCGPGDWCAQPISATTTINAYHSGTTELSRHCYGNHPGLPVQYTTAPAGIQTNHVKDQKLARW